MANSDPFQKVVDEAANQTAAASSPPPIEPSVPEPLSQPPGVQLPPIHNSAPQVVSIEPDPAPAPPQPPTDANSLNSLIDALMDSSKPAAPPQGANIIVGTNTQSAPPPIPGVLPPQDPKKSAGKKSKTGLIIATIVILLITLPIGIYFISQQQQRLTEQRSRAATGACYRKGTAYCADTNCSLYQSPLACQNDDDACCEWKISTVATITPFNTPVNTKAPPPGNTAIPPSKSGLWGPCTKDADCTSDFCGATGKCVETTARCIDNVYMAPDGDPCACPITPVNKRDPRCGSVCKIGSVIPCKNNYPQTGYTLKTCNGTITCKADGTFTACIDDKPAVCTGGAPIGGVPPGNLPGSGCDPGPNPYPQTCYRHPSREEHTFEGICIFYHCPLKCSPDGTCGELTPGAWWEFAKCSEKKLQTNECGQIDTVDETRTYCIPKTGCDALIQCPTTCIGIPTNTQKPASTPTKTPPTATVVPPTATATVVPPTTTGTPKPTATGTIIPTNTLLPTSTATNAPTATAVPTTIASCSQSCSTDTECESGLVCYTGMCRKPECLDETDCTCPVAVEDTPVPETPVTGVPSFIGILSAVGGVLLILVGLLL